MEQAFRALLLASSGVTALVGTRVNWGEHPQGSPLPAIVLSLISGIEGKHMNGTGPHEGRVQVDCYAMTYGAAKNVSRAVIGALHTYRGDGFLFIEHAATRDGREGGSNEADRPFRASMDFMTTWRAS